MNTNDISGGGFFYSYFTQCSVLQNMTVDCGVGVYGPWRHIGAPYIHSFPHKIRYVQVDVSADGGVAGVYYFQLGIGAAGSETVWQPSNPADGFIMDFSLAGVLNAWKSPFSFNFPASLPANTELCARAMLFVGPMFQTLVIKIMGMN